MRVLVDPLLLALGPGHLFIFFHLRWLDTSLSTGPDPGQSALSPVGGRTARPPPPVPDTAQRQCSRYSGKPTTSRMPHACYLGEAAAAWLDDSVVHCCVQSLLCRECECWSECEGSCEWMWESGCDWRLWAVAAKATRVALLTATAAFEVAECLGLLPKLQLNTLRQATARDVCCNPSCHLQVA